MFLRTFLSRRKGKTLMWVMCSRPCCFAVLNCRITVLPDDMAPLPRFLSAQL